MRVDPMNLCVIQHILRFISGYSIMHAAPRGIRERVPVPFETQLFVAWAEQSRTGILFPATT
jgi:hypothetical protein